MRKLPLTVLTTLALLLTTASTSLAFDFTAIEVPGGDREGAYGVNNLGQIVGSFQPDGVDRFDIWVRQPGGTFNTFALPTGRDVQVHGINDLGQVAGGSIVAHDEGEEIIFIPWVYNINTSEYHEYGYAPMGNELLPDGGITEVTNDGQTIVGWYDTSVDQFQYLGLVDSIDGFSIDGPNFTTIDGPADRFTFIWGTNDSGVLVGREFRSAFVSTDGVDFDVFQVDDNFTTAFDINNEGVVVGSYRPSGSEFGFIRTDDGLLTGISAPGASHTDIWGINDAGVFVGNFTDDNGTFPYFSVVPEPTSCVLLAMASLGLATIRRCR